VSEGDNIDSTQTLALTTDVLWGVGAVAVVTGFVLWITGALDEERQVPTVSLDVSPKGASTTFTARF
jgi:hypothetical protein